METKRKKAVKVNNSIMLTPDIRVESDSQCYSVYMRVDGSTWKHIGYPSKIENVFEMCGQKAIMFNLGDLSEAIRILNDLRQSKISKILEL